MRRIQSKEERFSSRWPSKRPEVFYPTDLCFMYISLVYYFRRLGLRDIRDEISGGGANVRHIDLEASRLGNY
jgi:hypothetical protein